MLSAPPYPRTKSPTADELVRQLTHFPSAPRVLPRLKRLLTDGNSAMVDIVSFIRLDPGIAARVLQVGNSAFYGNGNVCFTVDQAVHRVGYDQIYELVSYAVASQVLEHPLAAYRLEADDLWEMSVACALAAEHIAAQTGQDQSIAYTTGLLHGVGMVAVNDWVCRHHAGCELTVLPLPGEAVAAERALLGFTHAEAGAALLKLWEFPGAMTEPVRWQYLPRLTVAHNRAACLLHAAKWLRTAVCTESSLPPAPDPAILQALGLGQRHLEAWLPEIRARLDAVSSLLQVETGETAELNFPGGRRALSLGPDPRGRHLAA
ncbi:MAG: HDOD domain-containing protein [Opitutaceae bacterium]|nr:HDOD domain-containing protein [Opitutaceae bacterium]